MELDGDEQADVKAGPAYVVVQCGVDGLAGDPHAVWNWDIDVDREGSMGWCIQRIVGWIRERAGLKAVFLGGGESILIIVQDRLRPSR